VAGDGLGGAAGSVKPVTHRPAPACFPAGANGKGRTGLSQKQRNGTIFLFHLPKPPERVKDNDHRGKPDKAQRENCEEEYLIRC
jgi:hypothetical protein